MNILHIGLACKFTEGFNYQDNILSDLHAKAGHNVTYISDCFQYLDGKLVKVQSEDRILINGVRLIRVPHLRIVNDYFSEKIRAVKNFYSIIQELKPDVILVHGVPGYELKTLAKYKKNHPNIKLYVDSHEDYNNSATNFVSKYILHKLFYRWIVRKSLYFIDKVLCVTPECFPFLKELYGIPVKKMELFPLGGVCFDTETRLKKRSLIRKELGLTDDEILVVHSGKMDRLKRTEDILRAFIKVKNQKLRLILIGSIPSDVEENILPIIEEDKRISYLGWKSSDQLMNYLCASDLYIQPGSQSATMQNALCCGTAVALYPHESHRLLLEDKAFYIETIEDIQNLLEKISNNRFLLDEKRKKSLDFALEKLDYEKIAKRVYE